MSTAPDSATAKQITRAELADPSENACFNQLDKARIPVVDGNADAIMHDRHPKSLSFFAIH